MPTGVTVDDVETVNATSGAAITLDTTDNFTGLSDLNTNNSGAAQTITASATTDITATVDAQDTNNISVDGGKDVAVTSTGQTVVGGQIAVGGTTAASGDVTINATISGDDNATQGPIAVTGGETVSVTTGTANAVNTTNTQAAVTVTGDSSTKSVSVSQDAAAAAATAVVGKVNGDVTVNDVNRASATDAGAIETVTVSNAADVTVNSGALKTLNLSGDITTVDASTLGGLDDPKTSLSVNLDGVTATGDIDIDSDIETLNIASSNDASTLHDLNAAGATAITVSGDAQLTLTENTLTASETISVTNTAGVIFGTALGAGVDFTAAGGDDSILLSDGFTGTVTMGDGEDAVTYGGAAGTDGSVDAGAGNDTIIMTDDQAAAADGDSTFNDSFSGFETLELSEILAASTTINLANLNDIQDVTLTAGGADASTSKLSGLDSNGTIRILAPSAGVVAVLTDAGANQDDVVNVILENSTSDSNAFGSITAADVESVNLTAKDTGTAGNTTATVDTATLVATSATDVTISGNNGLNLTNSGNLKITSFDASGVQADAAEDTAALLAVTSTFGALTSEATITGGEGDDVLDAKAATKAVTMNGGAGGDTLTGSATASSVLSGGDGDDTLVGGAAADTIDGGDGVDTYTFSSANIVEQAGSSTTTGAVINLGADALTATEVNAAMGDDFLAGTQTEVASNTSTYLFSTESVTNASVVDTLSSIENVVGSNKDDLIVGSSGDNILTGGAGADVLIGGDGEDIFVYADGDGSAAGTASGTFTGHDNVTDFSSADDSIKFLEGAAVDTSSGKQTITDGKAYVFDNAQAVDSSAVTTLTDFTDVDKAVNFINDVSSATAASGLDYIIAVNNDTAGTAAVYYVENATTDAVAAGEVELLGIIDGNVEQADFIS